MNKSIIRSLVKEYGLENSDYYFIVDDGFEKCIIKRSGIDKIQIAMGMIFKIVNYQTVPYGSKMAITLVAKGFVPGDEGLPTETIVCVNPDNCKYPNYAEVAQKRAKSRILLELAELYQHNVFSEEESEKFVNTMDHAEKATAIINGVDKLINKENKSMDQLETQAQAAIDAAKKAKPLPDEKPKAVRRKKPVSKDLEKKKA